MTQGRGKRRFLILLCLSGFFLFAGLGVWQVERRAWKLDLIARVDARVHAAPEEMPQSFDARRDEYRRVRVAGTFLNDRETLVDALTERGAGFWLLTPLQTAHGAVLINRGFVPGEKAQVTREARPAVITGLMRATEPDGRFLRPNRPSQERWYSRDVAAIAEKRGLPDAAPFFVDADAAANAGRYPIGGMTVIRFRNMHLAYALTWFALAGLCVVGLVLLRKPHDRLN